MFRDYFVFKHVQFMRDLRVFTAVKMGCGEQQGPLERLCRTITLYYVTTQKTST
jgi:hypothetical protein